LKNFKEACLLDRHSVTLRGLQHTNCVDLCMVDCVDIRFSGSKMYFVSFTIVTMLILCTVRCHNFVLS